MTMLWTFIALVIMGCLLVLLTYFHFCFVHKDKCPQCGGENLEEIYIEATTNYSRRRVRCKTCGNEFYI